MGYRMVLIWKRLNDEFIIREFEPVYKLGCVCDDARWQTFAESLGKEMNIPIDKNAGFSSYCWKKKFIQELGAGLKSSVSVHLLCGIYIQRADDKDSVMTKFRSLVNELVRDTKVQDLVMIINEK